MKSARHSGPGPDGLPYCAWYGAGAAAARTLLLLLRECSAGVLPPGLNEQAMVFVPKDVGDDEGDVNAGGAHRDPGDTRPLSLKNTDVKVCTAVVNYRLKSLVS